MRKKILIALLILLVLIQFFRPERNQSVAPSDQSITQVYAVPQPVENLLKRSCYDCHSNNTAYPWYANVQPVAWWLNHHIEEGKDELNFDAFATYRLSRQYRKLEEVVKQVKEGEMPLGSYTLIHRDAKLTEPESKMLIDWAEALRSEMRNRFPADSLVRRR